MKILRPGIYYVSVVDGILKDQNEEDFSDLVKDFMMFNKILNIDVDGDLIELGYLDTGIPFFAKYPLGNIYGVIFAENIIDFESGKIIFGVLGIDKALEEEVLYDERE